MVTRKAHHQRDPTKSGHWSSTPGRWRHHSSSGYKLKDLVREWRVGGGTGERREGPACSPSLPLPPFLGDINPTGRHLPSTGGHS